MELTRLVNWAVLPTADADALFEEPDLNEVMRWANAQPLAGQNELLRALPAQLPQLDPAKASAVLVLGGGLVENGADPDALLPSGLAHLERLQALFEQGEAPPPAAWRFTVIGLMALLCRSRAGRALLHQQASLLSWLEDHEELSGHFFYLLRVADVSDEDKLLLIFPAYETGLELSAYQVNNTFHLLTLVQPLVLGQAAALGLQSSPAPTSEAVLRYALGNSPTPPEEQDYNRYEWLNARAYQGGPLNRLELAWGEAPVSALPRVRGQVVLLATENPDRIARSWDAGFLSPLHDANRAQVHVRRLVPPAEIRALLAELHPPVAPPAPVAGPKPSIWERLRGK